MHNLYMSFRDTLHASYDFVQQVYKTGRSQCSPWCGMNSRT